MTKPPNLLKRADLLVLIFSPILAVFLSLLLETNYLTTILLFYGPLSFWLSLRSQKEIRKTFLFSLILSIPLGVALGYLGTSDHSWFVPTTLFPRLLNIVPIEDLIWFFFFIYTSIIFYKHFFDREKNEFAKNRMRYLQGLLVILLALFFIVFFTNPALLVIPYAYLWIGIIFVLFPTILVLLFFPRLLSKSFKTGFYFFVHGLLFEITGLQLNLWSFPGSHFIGHIKVLGFSLPFEEFFFWILLGTVSVLCYYEFFDDDRK